MKVPSTICFQDISAKKDLDLNSKGQITWFRVEGVGEIRKTPKECVKECGAYYSCYWLYGMAHTRNHRTFAQALAFLYGRKNDE